MSTTAEALRELHRIHRQRSDLKDRLARCPRQLAAVERRVVERDSELNEAKDVNQRARIAADEKQLQLRQREARIEELRGKFVHIRYFALHDEQGAYLGTLEVTQDVTAIRALSGERRLLQYDGEAAVE